MKASYDKFNQQIVDRFTFSEYFHAEIPYAISRHQLMATFMKLRPIAKPFL